MDLLETWQGTESCCHCLDAGKDSALHDLQIDVRVDTEASLKDVRGHDSVLLTFLEAIRSLGAWETPCQGSLISVRAFLSWFTRLRSTPVISAILLSVKISPFLVRIMTTAHLLSASVHVTSARGPKPVAIVLQLVCKQLMYSVTSV